MARSALLNVMTQAATRAGRTLSHDFGEIQSLQTSVNGPREFAEKSVTKVSKGIREALQKARPTFPILVSEKLYPGGEKQNRWLVEPLCGVNNFHHGLPYFGVSIALEREGAVIAGVVYNPVLDHLFVAEKGRGAFCNDRRIRVAGRKRLAEASVGYSSGNGVKPGKEAQLKAIAHAAGAGATVRNFGCPALDLCWVAQGILDGSWHNSVTQTEYAAGNVIIRESGGTMIMEDQASESEGFHFALSGNFDICRSLSEVLRAK